MGHCIFCQKAQIVFDLEMSIHILIAYLLAPAHFNQKTLDGLVHRQEKANCEILHSTLYGSVKKQNRYCFGTLQSAYSTDKTIIMGNGKRLAWVEMSWVELSSNEEFHRFGQCFVDWATADMMSNTIGWGIGIG